jgi:hypothetical protein
LDVLLPPLAGVVVERIEQTSRCAQSVVALKKEVRAWTESWTADPKPFIWHKTARRDP